MDENPCWCVIVTISALSGLGAVAAMLFGRWLGWW